MTKKETAIEAIIKMWGPRTSVWKTTQTLKKMLDFYKAYTEKEIIIDWWWTNQYWEKVRRVYVAYNPLFQNWTWSWKVAILQENWK